MLAGFKNSRMYPLVQRALRVLQFLSALSSLIVFSIRIRRLSQLTNALTHSNGAVEGILCAAVAYTLGTMVVTFLLKGARNQTSNLLRWFLVLMDVLFVGAFIGVSVLTRPNGGSAGPCRNQLGTDIGGTAGEGGCKLPLGTFITAIISTILHFLTALFQNIRERQHNTHDTYYGKHGNNYAMDGRDSATLHGRDSSTAPGVGYQNATGYNNTLPTHGHHHTSTGYDNTIPANNHHHTGGSHYTGGHLPAGHHTGAPVNSTNVPSTGASHYNRGSNAV